MVKKLWRYVKPFSSDTGTLWTDGRTDGQTDRFAISISRISILHCWRAIKMVWVPMMKKIWRYVYSFRQNVRTWQTDGYQMTASFVLMYSIARQKYEHTAGCCQLPPQRPQRTYNIFCRAQLCYRCRRRVVSVCPSHARNASKLMNLGSCGFYQRLAQGL